MGKTYTVISVPEGKLIGEELSKEQIAYFANRKVFEAMGEDSFVVPKFSTLGQQKTAD